MDDWVVGWQGRPLTLRVRRDRGTGGRAADGCHLIKCPAMQLGLGDIRLEEGHKQMLGQVQRRLAVEEGVQEAPEPIEINVLRKELERMNKTSPSGNLWRAFVLSVFNKLSGTTFSVEFLKRNMCKKGI